jgi:hypothetical protein
MYLLEQRKSKIIVYSVTQYIQVSISIKDTSVQYSGYECKTRQVFIIFVCVNCKIE